MISISLFFLLFSLFRFFSFLFFFTFSCSFPFVDNVDNPPRNANVITIMMNMNDLTALTYGLAFGRVDMI